MDHNRVLDRETIKIDILKVFATPFSGFSLTKDGVFSCIIVHNKIDESSIWFYKTNKIARGLVDECIDELVGENMVVKLQRKLVTRYVMSPFFGGFDDPIERYLFLKELRSL